MTQEQEIHKKKLEAERELILDQIKESEKPVDFGDDIDHFEEEGDEVQAMSNQIGIANSLKTRLGEIDAALEKIRIEKYGLCEKCGKKIEKEILDIDPESRLCKSDKVAK
jgi:RNA polymerase-binding transcription factor DksA